MILTDLKKASDTLYHKILLGKIKCIAFSDNTMKWLHYYLTNKAFFDSLGTVFSEAGTINCEVPQRFILELLFLLYINDTPQALTNTPT